MGGVRIPVYQYGNDIVVAAYLKVAAHSGRAAIVTEASGAVYCLVAKTIGVAAATTRYINLTDGQQLRVVSIEQFIVLQRVRKTQKVLHGGVTAARRGSTIG